MKHLTIILAIFIIAFAGRVNAQQTVTGTVTAAEDGSAMPGVNIVAKGTTVGTMTNDSGTYSINVPQNATTLIFSFIGMQTVEMPINGSVVDVVMKTEENALEDVVVTAMGISRQKKAMGYSVQAVKGWFSKNSTQENNPPVYLNPSTEEYDKIRENGFRPVKNEPLSTFSIDVDRASYSNMRRYLNAGQKVPSDAVKIEEMINYFDYDYEQPTGDNPYSIITTYADCPWNSDNKLLHVALQGKRINSDDLPPSNVVFLLDVSGSMDEATKLPLVVASLKLLVKNLTKKDKISIVVYAGAAGMVLPPTSGNEKTKIFEALDNLSAGGSTAGGAGIELAYKTAKENFIENGNNRIVLCTDGDFNVGVTSNSTLEDIIAEKRKTGIYLTCLGFGMGNYKDNRIEMLADKGNGNYAYIDNIQESNKTLVKEFGGTMFTIAKDVKIQVEFNPSVVQAYRLIGYENRLLNNEDFVDDKKDAGEMGAGHTVTVLYEIIPVGVESKFLKDIGDLKYQNTKITENISEIATIKTRYKSPKDSTSIEFNKPVENKALPFSDANENFRFSTSVAMFGMILRESEFKQNSSYEQVLQIAKNSKGDDNENYRSEFVQLVKTAKSISE